MLKIYVKNLLSTGLSQTEVAKRACVPQARISELANGKDITLAYETGKRLEKLHREVYGELTEQKAA